MNHIINMGKHKKWVMCIGYSGRGYFGMQRQRRDNKVIEYLPTIESELFKAFLHASIINEDEYHNPGLMYFQRAARTDKGVSAIKQIISMNATVDVQSYLTKINEKLPEHIRVFGAKRATKYFDCKNFCDARTYSYLMPSFSICPLTEITTDSFRVSKETVDKFNFILKKYIGTHNFHNFTSQKKPTDASAKRYIMHFECSQPFILSNDNKQMEFLVTRIKGQSFMLHQIRKMIGLAIAIMRGLADQSVIKRAFDFEQIDIPMAPGLGLLLEDVHFERYNKKYGGDGIHEPILWDEHNDHIYEFKNKFIYPEIIDTEIQETSMLKWLGTLTLHTFDTRQHVSLEKDNSTVDFNHSNKEEILTNQALVDNNEFESEPSRKKIKVNNECE